MTTHTILIVDDEPHIRYMLELKLRAAGLRVLSACDGEQAFELAARRAPHAIVTDFQMPRCDGLELCRRLAAHPSTAAIPVLMLTARGHRIPPDQLEHTNVHHLLAKPFSLREMLARLHEILGDAGGAEPRDEERAGLGSGRRRGGLPER